MLLTLDLGLHPQSCVRTMISYSCLWYNQELWTLDITITYYMHTYSYIPCLTVIAFIASYLKHGDWVDHCTTSYLAIAKLCSKSIIICCFLHVQWWRRPNTNFTFSWFDQYSGIPASAILLNKDHMHASMYN